MAFYKEMELDNNWIENKIYKTIFLVNSATSLWVQLAKQKYYVFRQKSISIPNDLTFLFQVSMLTGKLNFPKVLENWENFPIKNFSLEIIGMSRDREFPMSGLTSLSLINDLWTTLIWLIPTFIFNFNL